MIVTIDGPAGAGKSTVARALARKLGFEVLDTGAMYRAVTLAVLRAGSDARDPAALTRLLHGLQLELPPGRVLLNGEDVSQAIRTSAVTAALQPVTESPVVRARLSALQRELAVGRDLICEGRDQGTVVFPDAACKFFLVANPEERARRRQIELQARGESVSWQDVFEAQQQRDRNDAARALAPMVPAADAIHLDSTHLGLDEVVARMEREVERCRSGSNDSSGKPPG